MPRYVRQLEPHTARHIGDAPDGTSVCTVTDAAGRVIATIDPSTRERKDLQGRVIESHQKLAPRDAFVHMLLRPRPKASIAELPAPARPRGRPRKTR